MVLPYPSQATSYAFGLLCLSFFFFKHKITIKTNLFM